MTVMENSIRSDWPSVSMKAAPLVDALLNDAAALRIGVERMDNGCVVVDAGIECTGGLEAGRRIAEICLGGLGVVKFQCGRSCAEWPWEVYVHTAHPVLACLGSQYAGWSLSHGTGKGAFNALGSGPGRALAAKEQLFDELNYRDFAPSACLVLEVDKRPPPAVVEKVVRDCGVDPARLCMILTPTRSLAGTVQIVSRVLEVAMHKVHALGFPLDKVIDGAGCAPVPPPAPDFLTGMGRTNDAILLAGQVQLFVTGTDEEASDLAKRLPSEASKDYGRPFADVFRNYEYDFYRVDPMLFAPARVTVTSLTSGRSFHAGRINEDLLEISFGGGQ